MFYSETHWELKTAALGSEMTSGARINDSAIHEMSNQVDIRYLITKDKVFSILRTKDVLTIYWPSVDVAGHATQFPWANYVKLMTGILLLSGTCSSWEIMDICQQNPENQLMELKKEKLAYSLEEYEYWLFSASIHVGGSVITGYTYIKW